MNAPYTPEEQDRIVAAFVAQWSDSPSAPNVDPTDRNSLRARAGSTPTANAGQIEQLAYELHTSTGDTTAWTELTAAERRHNRDIARAVAAAGWLPAETLPTAEDRYRLAAHIFTAFNPGDWYELNAEARRTYKMIAAEIERLGWSPAVLEAVPA